MERRIPRMEVRRIVPAALLAAAIAAGPACAPPPGSRGGAVRASMTAFPASLSFIGKTDTNSEIFARLVTDSLFQYDAALRLVPRVASSWQISPDGKTLTVRLRDGVRWQDGAPVTARDVIFTVQKIRDPATEARTLVSQFTDLLSIEAVDPLTVRARYSVPYADVLDAWTFPLVPEHLASRDGEFLRGEFARHPVGCGPFRLARTEADREIVLAANADYWDGRPLLDGIVFRILPDERTAYQALLRSDLDLLSVTPDIWRQAEGAGEAKRLARHTYSRLVVWYVAWNQDGGNPFFTDPRVRRAMALALDREAFLASVLHGLGTRAAGTYHPASPWADPGVEPWPYEPAGAERLLDEAGWRRAAPGGTREAGGVPFAFSLSYPAGSQELTDRIAAWIQNSLSKIGVEVRLEKLEWKTFLERRRARQFHAAMASLNLSPSPDQYELYHSAAREGGMNFAGLADPEVDRLLERGRSVFDPELRRETYRALQRRLHELEPISCLFHFATPLLIDSRLEGVELAPLGLWLTTPGPRAWRWKSEPALVQPAEGR